MWLEELLILKICVDLSFPKNPLETSEKYKPYDTLLRFQPRRGARVVERDSLENYCTRKGTVGSNPTPSAKRSS
jgi:hypothetical protein